MSRKLIRLSLFEPHAERKRQRVRRDQRRRQPLVDLSMVEQCEAVARLLYRLGIPATLKGSLYCRNLVIYFMTRVLPGESSMQEAYEAVAAGNGATAKGVESSVRFALEAAHHEKTADYRTVMSYIGGSGPSPKRFLKTVAELIRLGLIQI